MKRTSYIYTSQFCKGAKVVATYVDGELSELTGLELIGQLWESIPINAPIPFKESEVFEMAKLYDYAVDVQAGEVEVDRVGAKVALFCSQYKRHLHLDYKVIKSEVGKLKGLEVSEELLKLYFSNKEWWGRQPKSITNFCSNYNNLHQLMARPAAKEKSPYPMEYSKEFEMKLNTNELAGWWKHLREIGYEAVKDGRGNVISWKLKAAAALLIAFFLFGGCGLLRRVQPVESTEPVTVIEQDTVTVKADTLQGMVDVTELEKTGTWTWENERTGVELTLADSSQFDSLEAAGWTWLDTDTAALDGAPSQPKKRPSRAVLVRVISKPVTVIEQDTTCVDVPATAPVYPAIPQEGQVNIWWLISAALALVSGIVFFIRKRKKDGQAGAKTEQD